MTCYTNCLHCDVCKCADEVEYKDCETMKADCPHFKNKADFVEVVRCFECDVPHNKFTGCPKLNGLIPPPNYYCAGGERKNNDKE